MFQGPNILYQDNVSGSMTTDYFFANGIQVADKSGSSNPTYFLVDNLDSIRLTTSSTGDIFFTSDYNPFGVPYGQSGSPIPQQRYTGKMTDAQVNSGIYYFDARYYDSNTGRFVSEDTATPSLSDPMTLNRYIYARDNPMTLNNPTGKMIAVPGGGIGNLYSIENAPVINYYAPAPVSTFSSSNTGVPNDAQLSEGLGMQTFSESDTGVLNDAQLSEGLTSQTSVSILSNNPTTTSTPPPSNQCVHGICEPTVCQGGICGYLESRGQAGAVGIVLLNIAESLGWTFASIPLQGYPPLGYIAAAEGISQAFGAGYALGWTITHWNTATAYGAEQESLNGQEFLINALIEVADSA